MARGEEGDGDLVGALLKGKVEGAVIERKATVGVTALSFGVVEVFALRDKFAVGEDPNLAKPPERDAPDSGLRRLNMEAKPAKRGRIV